MRPRRHIDAGADRPVYKQVADDVREQIQAGELAPGQALPGEARIADAYGVGINSVRSALDILRGERLVVTEKGVGTRVREQEERSAMDLPSDASLIVRPATAEDRKRKELAGLGDKEPVAEIQGADGETQLRPAYQHVFRTPPGS